MRDSAPAKTRTLTVALVGNPNSGKTTVFNALTGLRHRVGNYPGVTVERKEGRARLSDGTEALLLDLPGTYSLHPSSPDEAVTTGILLGTGETADRPDAVVCIVDAANLERNLYLVSQVLDLEIPLVVALNMVDVARRRGTVIDPGRLARALGVPVIPLVASRGEGTDRLREALQKPERFPAARPWRMPEAMEREVETLAGAVGLELSLPPPLAFQEALSLLTTEAFPHATRRPITAGLRTRVARSREKLEFLGIQLQTVELEARNRWIHTVVADAASRTGTAHLTRSDRIDRVVTHRLWGVVIFFAIMALMFQSIFSWAEIPMEWIAGLFARLGESVASLLPAGDLRDLIVDGALAGVASVVIFLPQILLLFFFLGLLEDSGYMARAALIMDRSMSRVGLHGKSFIPLLSSFACAIPGIMATRTIENQRDRLVTMLVAPLISCSARLPVYSLLIAATIPPVAVFGPLSLPALTLLAMYLLGLVAALTAATLFKKSILKGPAPAFYMELPPYRLPVLRSILIQMGDRAMVFLKNAGTIILGASILLWFLATYPKLDGGTPSERLQHSFAGRLGKAVEPALVPLGFDWKIGIGIVSSVFQREMFVSTMGTIYNMQEGDDAGAQTLREQMRADINPHTGRPLFTPLTGVSLMVFYVLAMQCLSTVAVMRRETNGWKWPLFQIGYMTVLAYTATFALSTIGTALGWGV
jgi:ferrous iron transport protein B